MFRDSEQSYGDFTLDVYERLDRGWQCDWWERGKPNNCGSVQADKRKVAIVTAKRIIDERNM